MHVMLIHTHTHLHQESKILIFRMKSLLLCFCVFIFYNIMLEQDKRFRGQRQMNVQHLQIYADPQK